LRAVWQIFQLDLQPVNFLVDQVDVHRLLARFSAQSVQVEVPTVNGDMGHLLAPTSSSKLDLVVAR
jgi:hypothetical protein